MKKIILVLFLLSFTTAYPQSKDTSDYFTAGIIGGSYIGGGQLYEVNDFFNSLGMELEYFKTDNLSFFAKGLFEFTGNDVKKLYDIPDEIILTDVMNPDTYRIIVNFGARYYLRKKNVNPYIQFSLCQESNYIGSLSYVQYGWDLWTKKPGYEYNYYAAIGIGFNVKLSRKMLFDFQYDIYRDLQGNKFKAFSAIGGFKFVL